MTPSNKNTFPAVAKPLAFVGPAEVLPIAEAIVKALEVTLSPKERRAIQNVATRDVEAYDYYLRGRKFFYQMNQKAFEFARQMYGKTPPELSSLEASALIDQLKALKSGELHLDPAILGL